MLDYGILTIDHQQLVNDRMLSQYRIDFAVEVIPYAFDGDFNYLVDGAGNKLIYGG